MQVPAIVLYGYTSNERELWLSTGDSITREYNSNSSLDTHSRAFRLRRLSMARRCGLSFIRVGRKEKLLEYDIIIMMCIYPTQFFCSQTSGRERAFSITINVNCAERLCRISLARRRRRCCCSLIIYYETGSSSFQHL